MEWNPNTPTTTQREWNDFDPLPSFQRPVDQNAADLLTRRIVDLRAFRAKVDAGQAFGRFYTVADSVNEALRRELILRIDIVKFRKRFEPTADDPKIAEVRKLLDDTGGHRRVTV